MTDATASPTSDRDYVDSIKAAVARHKWNPIVVWQGIHHTLTATMEMVLSFHPDWMKLHAGVEHDEVELGHNVAFMKQLSRSLNIDGHEMVFSIPSEETGLRVVAWLHEHGVIHFRKLQPCDKQVYFYTTLDSWVHLLERTLALCNDELESVEAVDTTTKGRKKLAYATIRGLCAFNVAVLRESAPRHGAFLKTLDSPTRRALQMAENLGATALRNACAAAAKAKAATTTKSTSLAEPIHEEDEEEKKACTTECAPSEPAETSPEEKGDESEVPDHNAENAMAHRIARLKVSDTPSTEVGTVSPVAPGPLTPPTPGPEEEGSEAHAQGTVGTP